ncbi:MAG: hypothetical protein A2Y33_13345 [Spirochaetes bacterium GWF1_51_8]|nr:MAG: hypothetical protein A2Y33_13345 [Spirochaetes bacterium GWF1_51_8]
MRRIAVSILILSAIRWLSGAGAAPLYAQPKEGDKLNGKLGVTPGIAQLDTADLNSRLAAYGYPGIPQWYFTLGAIYQLSDGAFVSDIEYIRYINNSLTGGGNVTTAGGWNSWLNLGYAIVNLPYFQFYPMVGLGGGTLTVKVGEDFTGQGFDSILSATNTAVDLEKGVYSVFLGGGIDFSIDLGESNPVDLLIGLRAGYIFDLSATTGWTSHGVALASGPNSGFSGFSARLYVGVSE